MSGRIDRLLFCTLVLLALVSATFSHPSRLSVRFPDSTRLNPIDPQKLPASPNSSWLFFACGVWDLGSDLSSFRNLLLPITSLTLHYTTLRSIIPMTHTLLRLHDQIQNLLFSRVVICSSFRGGPGIRRPFRDCVIGR